MFLHLSPALCCCRSWWLSGQTCWRTKCLMCTQVRWAACGCCLAALVGWIERCEQRPFAACRSHPPADPSRKCAIPHLHVALPNHPHPHAGAAPLHAAAHAGQVAALDLLLAAGADINSTDGHGATALEISRRYDQSDTEGALLRAGAADPDASKWPGARRIDLAGADGANTAAAGEKTAAAGEKAATAGDKAAAAQSAAQPAVQPAAETAAPPAAAPEPLAAHPPPVAVHVPEAAESEEGGDESGSGTEEEEEVMTSTAAAAEEAVVAFSAALAAAEAAEAAAEEAEGMPGEEAAQRAAAFRKEAEAAIVAAAAAAVMAGDSLDAVLPPRPGSPDNGGCLAGWALS